MKDKLIKGLLFLILLLVVARGCVGSGDDGPANELAPKITTNGKLDVSKVVKVLEQVRLGLPTEECEKLFGKPSSSMEVGGERPGDMTVVIRSWVSDHKESDLVVWSNKKNDVVFQTYMTIGRKTEPEDLDDMRDRLESIFGSRGSISAIGDDTAILWNGAKGTQWRLERSSKGGRTMELSRKLR